MTARVILLEGPDGVGKTTLAEMLQPNAEFRLRCGPPPEGVSVVDLYWNMIIDANVLATSKEEIVVIDRCHIGELVYGPLLRKRSRISDEEAAAIGALCRLLDVVCVHCFLDLNETMKRLEQRDGGVPDEKSGAKTSHAPDLKAEFDRIIGNKGTMSPWWLQLDMAYPASYLSATIQSTLEAPRKKSFAVVVDLPSLDWLKPKVLASIAFDAAIQARTYRDFAITVPGHSAQVVGTKRYVTFGDPESFIGYRSTEHAREHQGSRQAPGSASAPVELDQEGGHREDLHWWDRRRVRSGRGDGEDRADSHPEGMATLQEGVRSGSAGDGAGGGSSSGTSTGAASRPSAFQDGDALIRSALRTVLENGVESSPRGKKVVELPYPITLILDDPSRPFVSSNVRAANYRFGMMEAAWIIAGDDRVASIGQYNGEMHNFVDAGYTKLWGAYGPRLAQQMDHVVKTLMRDPDSRQAIVTTWRPMDKRSLEDDARWNGSSVITKDVPCTVAWHFTIRDQVVNLTVFMRSNDAWLGLPYDLLSFTTVQRVVAALLGRGVGRYCHVVSNMHLYEQHVERAWALLDEPQMETAPRLPTISTVASTWAEIRPEFQVLVDRGLAVTDVEWKIPFVQVSKRDQLTAHEVTRFIYRSRKSQLKRFGDS